GSKPTWITDAMLDAIPLAFPQVRAMVWFDEDKECDWRVNSSPSSLDAFSSALVNRYWHGDALTDGS
ncbi:MAG: endoglucanase, partial [Chloroflexota bacterium]